MTSALLSIFPFWFRSGVSTLVWVLSSLIFLSALASLIPQMRGSRISEVLYAVTEPLVAPVRWLLGRVPALQNLPFDFSPLVAMLLLNLIGEIVLWF